MTWKRDDVVWAKVAKLRGEGSTITEISREVGVTTTGVRYVLASMAGRPVNVDKDLPTATLDRMELLAYKISKRKVRIA